MPARRIADAVRYRRETELGLTQEALADRAGVSLKTIQNLEYARTKLLRMTEQLRHVERAMGWAPDSLLSISRGGAPTLLDEPAADPNALESKLPVKVVEALEQDVVDYEFIETRVRGVTQVVVTVRDPRRPPLTRRERKALTQALMRETEESGG